MSYYMIVYSNELLYDRVFLNMICDICLRAVTWIHATVVYCVISWEEW